MQNKFKVMNMRKEHLIILVLCICIFFVIFLTIKMLDFGYQENEVNLDRSLESIYEKESVVETVGQEMKVSPNVEFSLMKIYDKCGHYNYNVAELPYELINLNKDEIEDIYDDWEVSELSEGKLILAKKINGYCDNHFVIKLNKGKVSVYNLLSNGELNKYQDTEISVNFLPKDDIENLEKGIEVYEYKNVSSVLEDYE